MITTPEIETLNSEYKEWAINNPNIYPIVASIVDEITALMSAKLNYYDGLSLLLGLSLNLTIGHKIGVELLREDRAKNGH